jgi:DNA-binding GntR family transcriptional regulator
VAKNKSLLEQAYYSLRQFIIDGEMKPGEKLIESKLAEKIGISRTPIREALRRLELEGLVTYIPLQGAQVTRFDKKSIIDLYRCRATLEGLAASEAALNINKEQLSVIEESIMLAEQFHKKGDLQKTVEKNSLFHEIILLATNNNTLIQLMGQIKIQILRFRTITSIYGFRPTFMQEHKEIYESLKDKAHIEAGDLMKLHVERDLETILDKLETNKIL